jgi:hypothetical protein
MISITTGDQVLPSEICCPADGALSFTRSAYGAQCAAWTLCSNHNSISHKQLLS